MQKVHQTSDRRCKKWIEPISDQEATEALKAIVPTRYTFIDSGRAGIGCIAQNLYRKTEAGRLPMVVRHGKHLASHTAAMEPSYPSNPENQEDRSNKTKKSKKERADPCQL